MSGEWPPKDGSAVRLPAGITAGGPLIIPIEVRDIVGAAMKTDNSAVALKLELVDGNRAVLGLTAPGVDAMIETLQKIRAEMTAAGVEKTIPFAPVHTAQVGINTVEGAAFVAMIFDRSLESAKAYLLPPKPARILARQLITAAQQASSARGDLIEPEQACPGHVASSDNPKVCGRCGTHIDSLRPIDDEPMTPEMAADLTKRAT